MTLILHTLRQTARLTGLSVHTLRSYDRIGLLGPLTRGAGGHQRFEASDLVWLEFLTRLRITGMSIQKMRRFADLRRRGKGTVGLRRRLLEEHARTVAQKLKTLQEDLRIVRQKIDYYQALKIDEGQGS